MLSTVRTVIVDEIHAVAGSKRGSHLALSLERLQALAPAKLTRIGLSATQKPIEEVARFLVGASGVVDGVADCEIVDIGYGKQRDLALEVPPTPLQRGDVQRPVGTGLRTRRRTGARASHHAGVRQHPAHGRARRAPPRRAPRQGRRRRAPRQPRARAAAGCGAAPQARRAEGAGRDRVAGTGPRHRRRRPRRASSARRARSPTFLQRAGRSGHAVGGVPKARLFPQSRDELVECAALLDCVRRGELDALRDPEAPLDVLAQQIVAETASREWDEDALFALVRRAWPYARLSREDFDAVVRMLAEGFTTRRGPRAGYVHRDAVHQRLRERRGARMTALMSGGTIPDTGDYAVILEPRGAQRSAPSTRISRSRAWPATCSSSATPATASCASSRAACASRTRKGQPPNIPFWLGEAPGRSDELSRGVSRLREEVARAWTRAAAGAAQPRLARRDAAKSSRLSRSYRDGARRCHAWLIDEVGIVPKPRTNSSTTSPAPRPRSARMPTQSAHRARALLRRIRRHPAGDPHAVRQPPQPRLGPGAAQALLPQVQLRTAGRGDRGRDRAVAVDQPQLPAGGGRALPAFVVGAATCWSRRCSTRRCSACAGAGTRPPRWRCRASSAARRCRRSCSG